MNTLEIAVIVIAVLGALPAAGRWLRVAQREHYIAPWVLRITWMWLTKRPLNAVLLIAVIVVVAGGTGLGFATAGAYVGLVVLALLPVGLSPRGRTSPLVWTGRLRRLAVVWGVVVVALGVLAFVLLGPVGLVAITIALPALMDLCLAIMAPIEKRASRRFVVSAQKRLGQVRPTVVAITGSYGKTSTKGYVAHLLGSRFAVVASPASFNNLMGLSRAVNERVVPGTEVFVAEMGIYGEGEIRELSISFPPDIAAITTIGEAHLSRMGTRDVIFRAKAEITEKAKTVVLPIDQEYLGELAETCRAQGKRVVSVSTTASVPADVVVVDGTVTVQGSSAAITLPVAGHAVNIAIAVGIAVALDVPLDAIAERLNSLPSSPHRAEIQVLDGVTVLDDTYNSNPVGAQRAVHSAAELAAERGGPLVVVSPGMIELGSVQYERNRAFAASVAQAGGELYAVARTNRAALTAGAPGSPTFDRREPAVAAAVKRAADRGVILYENDLPDHYP